MELSFVYIALIIIIYNLNRNSTKVCKWIERNILHMYDRNKTKRVEIYLKMFNKLNIKYILGFGSELGSYRNNGLIPKDHDIDLLIPLWLNYHIFKCKLFINYTSRSCKIYTHPKYLLCNKSRYDYIIMLKEYIQNKLRRNVSFWCRHWGLYGYTSCWIFKSRDLFIDIWILLGNEYVYNSINRCLCKFNGIITYCCENALHNIINLYGINYTIPSKKGSGEVIHNCIIYPTTNNSKIQIYKY